MIINSPIWPPSSNHLYRVHKGQAIMSKGAREYYDSALQDLAISGQLGPEVLRGDLAVRITLRPPNRRRFDIDNRAKALLDLLTKAAIWEDDDQVKQLTMIRCGYENGQTGVTIEIWPLPKKPASENHAIPKA